MPTPRREWVDDGVGKEGGREKEGRAEKRCAVDAN
jgi:hypothetical protein